MKALKMNKSLTKTNDALQQEKLPKKYIFLLGLLWLICIFLILSAIQEYKHIQYLKSIKAFGIWLISFVFYNYYGRKKFFNITRTKIHLIYVYILLFISIYYNFHALDLALKCPFSLEYSKESTTCIQNISNSLRPFFDYFTSIIVFMTLYITFIIFYKNKQTKEQQQVIFIYYSLIFLTIITIIPTFFL